ncbi:MAG: chemotaxis protein CheW [Betaproteobacteria bacterium]|jgi:purine-binding chemotaxis protein CheW
MMTSDYASFYLDGLYFGITATEVLELNNNLDVTPVPKSPKTVRGIMNLRGQLVPAIDMYQCLGLTKKTNKEETISIILQGDGFSVALLVDDVGPIIPLYESTFEQPPNNFSLVSRELVLGVHKLPERLIIILDPKGIANFVGVKKKQLQLS